MEARLSEGIVFIDGDYVAPEGWCATTPAEILAH